MVINLEDRRSVVRVGWREHGKTVFLRLMWQSDAMIVRLLLALASLLWAIGAVCHPDTFHRAPYALIEGEAASAPRTYGLSAAFLLHFVGVLWRTLDPVERVGWALFVNGYGLVVWWTSTAILAWSLHGLTAGTSTEWAVCCFAAWAFFRTGSGRDAISA